MNNSEGGGNPLHQLLLKRGIHVHPEWLGSYVREMEVSQPGFSTFGLEKQGELAFAYLLITDFNEVGAGCLPDSFETLHATELAGPFVLQVDEISDIGAPLRERYHERGPMISRCLKLSMTDGVQRVVGIEYKPIAALRNLFPAGLKICVRNVFVRRGTFLLNCDSVEVLGGLVHRLEEARQRAVQEVNKPARGSRNRRGQTGELSLAERATAEAWSRNTDGANPPEATVPRDNSSGHPVQPTAASIFQSFVAQEQPARGLQASQVPDTNANIGRNLPVSVQQSTAVVGPPRTEPRLNVPVQQVSTPVGPAVQNLEVKKRQTTLPWVQTLGSHSSQQRVLEQSTAQPSVAGTQTPMTLDSDDDDDDLQSIPPPSQRNRTPVFNEEPFTYLALLKEKLSAEPGYNAAVGKIKCVLTGVKDFKFKDCEEFTLIVHIDDGSLVTEALIHHEVVQKMVGFSPKEVNRALARSNTPEAREMKSNMKRFQAFLKKFEGLTYVQYKQSCDIPVISHMEEGVTDGHFSALQNRVGKDTSVTQRGRRLSPEFIDVSP